MDTTTIPHRRFRGSRLDHLLGNALGVASVVVPPFVYGMEGLIPSLIFVNGLLILSLVRTPDRYHEQPTSSLDPRRKP